MLLEQEIDVFEDVLNDVFSTCFSNQFSISFRWALNDDLSTCMRLVLDQFSTTFTTTFRWLLDGYFATIMLLLFDHFNTMFSPTFRPLLCYLCSHFSIPYILVMLLVFHQFSSTYYIGFYNNNYFILQHKISFAI